LQLYHEKILAKNEGDQYGFCIAVAHTAPAMLLIIHFATSQKVA